MAKTKAFKSITFTVAAVNITLLIAVFYLMGYVQRLLDSDVKINLTEIVTQNKDVITSKLMLELNNLDLVSKQLSERFDRAGSSDKKDLKKIFMEFAEEKEDGSLCWAAMDGLAVSAGGLEVDISGRHYYRLAVHETKNISDRMISRINGEDIFVISVPMYHEDKVIGTIQKQYTPKEMYDLCSVSLFSEQGYMYIINSQGYIMMSSQQDVYNRESDNYYRMIYLDNPQESKRLEEDINKNISGFMETVVNGERVFSAYTPIDEVYDWYLISSVATDAVSPNANIVIKMFYIVLIAVVSFFAVSMFYILHLKKGQQLKLKNLAFVDSVTHGSTYTRFMLDLRNILHTNRGKQFYIFAFDIDNFKYINNFYGFDFGDSILCAIMNLYSQKLSANERIARIYSDHFVVLLENAEEERLRTLFCSELILEDVSIYLSAGLYPISTQVESVNLMVDKANMAAQKIKGLHDKQIAVYSEEFDRQMIRNEQLKRSVEQALADDEIVPFFQAKVDIEDRSLAGAEALARWRTKEGKFVPPCDFIPICEETGLIVMVDMAIFEKTLQFIRQNLDRGVHCVPISVNFSRLHLMNKEFLDTLLEKMEKYQIPPHLIELELTETVMYENIQRLEEFIEKLHVHGMQISMDDFGSGYSSLHMLKDIEIDVLKIDQGFLRESAHSDRQRTVFAAISQMAQQLNIKVVVEGVETLENVDLMREFNCTIAQGYYFAKPMIPSEFEKIYEDGKLY